MCNKENMQNHKHILFVIAWVCLTAGISYSEQSGELRLEGTHIERLILQRTDGAIQKFEHPQETIRLPVGKYHLQDIRLKGGYIYRSRGSSIRTRVTVTTDKPATLKVGAPLKQTVSIERRGPVLEINYQLKGAGGEAYSFVVNRNKRPMFTVFKGDKQIGSGQFEFG